MTDELDQLTAQLTQALEIATLGAGGEPQLAIRPGGIYAPRLARAAAAPERTEDGASEAGSEDARVKPPAQTIVITGGTGGLGALLALHLAENARATKLVLASRRGDTAPGAKELAAEIEQLGCKAELVACDTSDAQQARQLIEQANEDGALTGVIHAAGVLDDGIVESMSSERIDRVFAPKVSAAWNLHEATRGIELSEFTLFSSAAGVFGSPGQANYAAANSFLDALAAERRAEGLAGASIAWGLWQQEEGMGGELSHADRSRIEKSGGALSPELGLELYDRAGELPQSLLVAMPLDLRQLASHARAGMLPPILRGLVRVPASRRKLASGSLAASLAKLPAAEHEAFVLELVKGQVAAVLGHASGAAIDAGKPFKDLGFDSLGAVELRNRLAQASGVKLSSTVVFDYPTSAAVASFLIGAVAGDTRAITATRARTALDEPIAIVGMSCKFPGGVTSPSELWDLVRHGRDATSEFPINRGWDIEALYDADPASPGTTYATRGGFLHEAGDFDAEFFGISPREALAMDPQQRLLLETAWQTIEDAGIDPASLRGSRTGVFAGHMYHDYATGDPRNIPQELEGFFGTGGSGSVVSGRLAYNFGLEGPAVTIDTACSSSSGRDAPGRSSAEERRVLDGARGRRHCALNPGRLHRVQPPARPRPGRPLQSPSRPQPTASPGQKEQACSCSSASQTQRQTATKSSR